MKVFLGIFLAVGVIVFGIFLTSPTTQGQKEQKEEPTIVQKGQVTEKVKAYSKEYQKLYSDRKGRKLSELSEIGKRKGNIQEAGVSINIPTIPTIGGTLAITTSEFLRNLSCKADTVVIGFVKSKSAHLTDDETFVYTEYEFSVQDVLKNNSTSPVEVNNNIQITRPGGLIKLDNQVIRVEDKLYEPLQTKKEYLLFLNFIPSANGYVVSSAEGDFILENSSLKTLSKLVVPEELQIKNDSQALINNLRSSIPNGCNQKITGGN